MIKVCNKENLEEIKQLVIDNKIKSLKIQERESADHKGEFHAEYDLAESPIEGCSMEFRLHNADVIDEFSKMLRADRVSKFTLTYNPAEAKSILNKAYKPGTDEVKKESIGELVGKIKSVLVDMNLSDKELENVVLKTRKGAGKVTYKPLTVEEALKQIISIIEVK